MAKDKKPKKGKKNKKGKSITKKKKNRMTAGEQRQMEIEIRKKMGEGKSAVEIIDSLGLQPHVFQSYIERIKDIDRNFFSTMTNSDVYTSALEKSRAHVKALQVMRKRFDYRKQFTALVAAIKQEHEINKDMIRLGQELGFIEKKGNDVSIETEFTFTTMTTDEVREQVNQKIEELNNMAGGTTIMMRPELMDAMGKDADKIKKFIPDYVAIAEGVNEKKTKVKTKIKLKRRS